MHSSNPLRTSLAAAILLAVGVAPAAATAQPPDGVGTSDLLRQHDSERQETGDGGQCPPGEAVCAGNTSPNSEAIRFELVDPLPATIPPGTVTPFVIEIVSVSELVVEDSAMLHYRKGLGAFITAPLTPLGADRYSVPLPAAPCGVTVVYYLSAEGDGGTVVSEPLDAPATTHTARAIVEEQRSFDDFETDTGWTTSAPTGQDDDEHGAWTRVVPIGTTTGTAHVQVQPDEDHTPDPGEMCFVTGQPNQVGDFERLTDVDGGPFVLLSPVITLDAPDARVHYARWFFSRNDLSIGDDELLAEISRDGGGTWHAVETVSSTGSWVVHSFSLSDFPAATGNQLQIRFSTSDEPNNSLTEAAVDDVGICAVLCAAAHGDYDGNGSIDRLDYIHLAGCFTGPVTDSLDDWCATFDFDEDSDVDLDDWRVFQFRFTSAGP